MSSPSAGALALPAAPVAPDPEVVEQARRRFTAKYPLGVLAARQRGRPAPVPDVHGPRLAAWERENVPLRQRLLQAEAIIDVQKKSQPGWGSS
ncbi:MAG: hypothetical protein KAX51_05285 [Chromatiaceae bacterium]|nr:hypothetical protein [Chromatiaceae bacterium]MBP8289209.1 hypothetical protein [Chromatiaceae bacterium]